LRAGELGADAAAARDILLERSFGTALGTGTPTLLEVRTPELKPVGINGVTGADAVIDDNSVFVCGLTSGGIATGGFGGRAPAAASWKSAAAIAALTGAALI